MPNVLVILHLNVNDKCLFSSKKISQSRIKCYINKTNQVARHYFPVDFVFESDFRRFIYQ